jgi:hypothetical protein
VVINVVGSPHLSQFGGASVCGALSGGSATANSHARARLSAVRPALTLLAQEGLRCEPRSISPYGGAKACAC